MEPERVPDYEHGRRRVRLLAMLGVCCITLAAASSLMWDSRAAVMPTEIARQLVHGGDEKQRVAGIVALLRDVSTSVEILRHAAEGDGACSRQAADALEHLRQQLRR